MKLWTIQHNVVAKKLSTGPHVAEWTFTPVNFRGGYKWMAFHLSEHTQVDAVPIWCWHSCGGKSCAGPTIETANDMLGDWSYYAPVMRVIELEVPEGVALLSSYFQWNELLDEAIQANETPDFNSRHVSMFENPLLKHDHDDVQATLPFVERNWVVDVRKLPMRRIHKSSHV